MKAVSVDVMGGDLGASATVPAVLEVLKSNPNVSFYLVGLPEKIYSQFDRLGYSPCSRVTVVETSEVVAMDESPSKALRNKKKSSMRVALNLVKEGTAHACVSSGNTGALMATAKFVLKTLPGISRPAILTRLPSFNGKQTRILDLGANVDVSCDQLVEFAVMGSVLAESVGGIALPKVGLVNVGEEDVKGNALVKEAHARLSELNGINYVGYIEGNDWFSGKVDVAVCDGFVGNVALKAVEGALDLLFKSLVRGFNKNPLTKLGGLIARPVLKGLLRTFDRRSYNGASFVGLNGVVFKSHGSADAIAFSYAIREAIKEIDKSVPELIGSRVGIALTNKEK